MRYSFAAAAIAFAMLVAPARAQSPIKIGILADLTSTYADIGGMGSVESARMAVADFGGAVLGRPVEIVFADGLNKPDVGANIARQWYDSGVEMIADLPASGIALSVMQVAREKRKIALVTSAGSSDITGKLCSPYAAHWTWDTYAVSHGTGKAVVQQGGKSWFFITADYVFGQTLQRDTAAVVQASGGTVVGSALHPLGSQDFSSYLLQAQASGAKVLGLANGGTDMINSVKQAAEYHLPQNGIMMAALIGFISDVHTIGLQTAQGLMLTEAFYWDQDDATRAWSNRFYAKMKRMPSMTQAGTYSGVLHYLKALRAAGSTDPDAIMAKMRELPIEDFMTHGGRLREDGRVMRDMYLFRVKTPAASHSEWDLYEPVATIPAEDAFRPLKEGGCPLIK